MVVVTYLISPYDHRYLQRCATTERHGTRRYRAPEEELALPYMRNVEHITCVRLVFQCLGQRLQLDFWPQVLSFYLCQQPSLRSARVRRRTSYKISKGIVHIICKSRWDTLVIGRDRFEIVSMSVYPHSQMVDH